jgi:hypothetical protein
MKRVWLALSVALSFGTALPMQGLAFAEDLPSTKAETARDVARATAKHALALEFTAWTRGTVSAATFNRDVGTFIARWGKATFASSSSLATASGISPAKNLPVTQYPEQSPSYCLNGGTCYCGPSTAETVLHYLQPTSYFGEVLISSSTNPNYYYGQLGLAGTFGSGNPYSRKYLETNYWGGETPWYVSSSDWPMNMSFNYWMSGSVSGYPYYTHYRPTSAADYETELTSDIWNGGLYTSGFPLAADIEEVQNGLHLPNHPASLEIQHWIALYGYSSSGTYTSYVDPVAGSALNWGVSAYNTGYSSDNIYHLVIAAGPHGGPYGIVW